MKKQIVLITLLLTLCSGAFAQSASYQRSYSPAARQEIVASEPEIIRLSRLGDADGLRRLLSREGYKGNVYYENGHCYAIMEERDAHGNNALHVASNPNAFYTLYSSLGGLKEKLLSQKNNAGETPWMSLISYERAVIFIKYFPASQLRQDMKEVNRELKSSGLNRMVGEIKRDALLKECSAGGQTMWQRADALWRMAKPGSREKENMRIVRSMIEKAAPFLVR